jgi:hypothetical protein
MAAQLILDTVADSSLEVTANLPTKIRGALVTGLTGDPSTALDQVIGLLAANSLALGSTITLSGWAQPLFFHRLVARPLGSDSLRLQLIFDTDFGGQQSALIVRTRGYLTPYQTNMVPGTRIPLKAPKWTDPANAKNTVPADNVTFTIQRPMREISVSGVKFGALPATGTYDGFIGYSNVGAWLGKNTGYWLITDGGADVSVYQGWYSFHLSAMTKNVEDWSETGLLMNKQTGRYVEANNDDITALIGLPYQQGIIGTKPGLMRWGPYPTTNYFPLFGFS